MMQKKLIGTKKDNVIRTQMTVVKHPNSYGLYGHNGKRYNRIMTYDNGVFSFSQPNFVRRWSSTEPIPDDVMDKYSDSEMRGLFKFWNTQGFYMSVVN